MRRYVIPFNRYSRLERWLSKRLDRQVRNGDGVGAQKTVNLLYKINALLMVSVPHEISEVSTYSDFR
jgi:hypothetical protein